MIEKNIPQIDAILGDHKTSLGEYYAGYRNHVYRMVNFCFAQRELSETDRSKIKIAGSFHDIGIWSGKTFDYLPPSIELAREFLDRNGQSEWIEEITEMIDQHHKIRPIRTGSLAEIFRRADLMDVSLGIFRSGISKEQIQNIRKEFPNEGFHKNLLVVAGRWACRHPFRPVPVLKF